MKPNIIEPLPKKIQELGFEKVVKLILGKKVPPRKKSKKETANKK